MAKHTEIFLCLPFLKYSIFLLVRRNCFEQVYIYMYFCKYAKLIFAYPFSS